MLSFYSFAQSGPIENLRNTGLETGFSVQHLISQIIVFLIVSGTVWIWGLKPVRRILEERRRTIEESQKNAEQVKKELAAAQSERLIILTKANEEASALIAEAKKSATLQGELRLKEAATQAEDLLRKAHEAATLDRDRLMMELKRSVATLVIQTTEKIAGKVLTPDDQTRLNAETLRQLNASQN